MGISRRRERAAFGREVFHSPRKGKRLKQTAHRYCQNCDLPNDTRTTAQGDDADGEGGLVDKSGADPAEKENTGGCRFCGSFNSVPGHPKPLKPINRLKYPGRD